MFSDAFLDSNFGITSVSMRLVLGLVFGLVLRLVLGLVFGVVLRLMRGFSSWMSGKCRYVSFGPSNGRDLNSKIIKLQDFRSFGPSHCRDLNSKTIKL